LIGVFACQAKGSVVMTILNEFDIRPKQRLQGSYDFRTGDGLSKDRASVPDVRYSHNPSLAISGDGFYYIADVFKYFIL
jgi:hypothetical protein